MLKKLLYTLSNSERESEISNSNAQPASHLPEALTLSRDSHPVSRKQISRNALNVVYELNRAGYEAYLVGGCIRDLMLGKQPKDFDVATNATPEQVRGLFRRSRIVGRRFQITHVRFGREIIEVTTFRAAHSGDITHPENRSQQNAQGMLVRDNVYGSVQEDALRRDFTINALYYGVDGFKVIDYTGGLADLKSRTIRMIGNPVQRCREDPVRMLRAVRFAAKLDFKIEQQTSNAIAGQNQLIDQVAPARLFDEVQKLFFNGAANSTFELMQQYGLIEPLLPGLTRQLADKNSPHYQLLVLAFDNTNQRIAEQKPVTPSFLFACLLWPAFSQRVTQLIDGGAQQWNAMQTAGHQTIDCQQPIIAIPRRFSTAIREIWSLQYSLEKSRNRRARQLLNHPRFRAAYDFMLLRELAGEELTRKTAFWTELQAQNPVAEQANHPPKKNRHNRPYSGRNKAR